MRPFGIVSLTSRSPMIPRLLPRRFSRFLGAALTFCLLASAPAGHTGRVLRVSDRDPDVLRAVEAAGVEVGADATVTDAATLRIGDVDVALPAAAADAVWLSA